MGLAAFNHSKNFSACAPSYGALACFCRKNRLFQKYAAVGAPDRANNAKFGFDTPILVKRQNFAIFPEFSSGSYWLWEV
jgi:hypothetical protein